MLLHAQHLHKDFIDREQGRRVAALDDVSLSVAAGEFVCVIGPSGCGKSTLLNTLAGFQQPTAGEVRFKGRPVRAPGPERAMVFQDATLFPWLTARGNVEFGLHALGYEARARRERADEYLSVVGLADFAHAYPFELSGGMRQRVSLARALALHPDVLLMDEPFGALDSLTRERLQEELLRIWAERRLTVVFVTHNVEEAVFLGQRVIVFTPRPARIRADIALSIPTDVDQREGYRYAARRAIMAELAGAHDGDALGRAYTLIPEACDMPEAMRLGVARRHRQHEESRT